jgi:hypothetical protein
MTAVIAKALTTLGSFGFRRGEPNSLPSLALSRSDSVSPTARLNLVASARHAAGLGFELKCKPVVLRVGFY